MAARKDKPEKLSDVKLDDVISLKELATKLGKSMKTIERLCDKGLWSFKIGGERFTTHKRFNEFLQVEAARTGR